jgi:hypothetical protein
MTIETKYNIGDEVWYKGFEESFQDEISNIHINIDCLKNTYIYYEFFDGTIKEEYQLFLTKEELLKSL